MLMVQVLLAVYDCFWYLLHTLDITSCLYPASVAGIISDRPTVSLIDPLSSHCMLEHAHMQLQTALR